MWRESWAKESKSEIDRDRQAIEGKVSVGCLIAATVSEKARYETEEELIGYASE